MSKHKRVIASGKAQEPLEWFAQNLKFLIEDAQVGDRVELCFDAQDVTSIVLGMYSFIDKRKRRKQKFRWKDFEDDTALVHCLATAGWLGMITQLPPHQAEFLGLLQRDFGLNEIEQTPRELASLFLREGQATLTPDLKVDLHELERLQGEPLVKTFGDKAELAKEIFKLLQCIKGSWRTRLIEWSRHGLLDRRGRFDPTPYLDDEIFKKVKRVLDDSRGTDRSINNFSDAVAVAVLAERTRAFERDPARAKLSLFFDHAGELDAAIRLARVEGALKYRVTRNGKPMEFSVLRDWRYFFFRATFGQEGRTRYSLDELQGLLEQTTDIREGQESVPKEAVAALGPSGTNVDQHIEHMRDFRFFNTWLKSGTSDVNNVLADLARANLLDRALRETVADLSSQEIQEKFKEAQQTVRVSFESSVGTYQRASRLLGSIETWIGKISRGLRERHGGDSDIKADMMLILGLFRFPFPDDTYGRIERALKALTEGDQNEQLDEQRHVFLALHEVESRQPVSHAQLAFVLGMLWATELDREIISLVEREHSPVGEARAAAGGSSAWPILSSLVLAAALVRDSEEKRHRRLEGTPASDERQRQADQIVRAYRLQKRFVDVYERTAAGPDKARLGVGLAYIDFHLFAALWSGKFRGYLDPELGEGVSSVSLLGDAIHKARAASETAGRDNERLRVYALNQVLYYLADGILEGALEFAEFEKDLDAVAAELLAAKDKAKAGWHYRYDDTLARYYQAVGAARNDGEAWELGLLHVDRARNDCFSDPLIVGTASVAGTQESKGYYREFTERYDLWKRGRSGVDRTPAVPQDRRSTS